MGHKKHHHKKNKACQDRTPVPETKVEKQRLEICLKCDSAGVLEAITGAVQKAAPADVAIDIIHAGVGAINKTDIFLAQTGSGLLLGFGVDMNPNIDNMALEHGVEIHLYDTIYRLVEDIRKIAANLLPQQPVEEKILGTAKVIALFKSSRKGIILGCEVQKGRLALRDHFRVIAAMGPVYNGIIESLHIEKNAVNSAKPGQLVGLKIRDFKKAAIGDMVESYQPPVSSISKKWKPQGGVFRYLSTTH